MGNNLQEAARQDKSAVRAAVAACGGATQTISTASSPPIYVICNLQHIPTESFPTCYMGTPI